MGARRVLIVLLGLVAGACDKAQPEPIACPAPSNQTGQVTITPSGASASFGGFGASAAAPCGCRTIEEHGAFPADMATLPDGAVIAPSAGDITIAGDRTIVMSPDSHGRYPEFSDNGGPIFSTPGKPLEVSAAGGTIPTSSGAVVPAFSATLTTPADVVVDSPAIPASGLVMIDQKHGLTLTWHGADQLVEVDVSGSGFEYSATLRCTFAGPAGGGFISSKWLTGFDGDEFVSVQTAAATTASAGSWKVLVDVNRRATTPTHQPYRAHLEYK